MMSIVLCNDLDVGKFGPLGLYASWGRQWTCRVLDTCNGILLYWVASNGNPGCRIVSWGDTRKGSQIVQCRF